MAANGSSQPEFPHQHRTCSYTLGRCRKHVCAIRRLSALKPRAKNPAMTPDVAPGDGSGNADTYLAQLDAARLEGAWAEVHGLVAEVERVVPQRTCLILAVKADALLNRQSGTELQQLLSMQAGRDDIHKIAQELESQLRDYQSAPPSDVLSAVTTLAELRSLEERWQDVLSLLDGDSWKSLELPPEIRSSAITRLSFVRANYVLGQAYHHTGSETEAAVTWQQGVDIARQESRTYSELDRWKALCSRGMTSMPSNRSAQHADISLFDSQLAHHRSWLSTYKASRHKSDAPKSVEETLKEYHKLLSDILRSNIIYPHEEKGNLALKDTTLTRSNVSSRRLRQFRELQELEQIYHNHLMSSTKFPKASESNERVEAFMDQVIVNWRIINGEEWSDSDVGQIGRPEYTRTILDYLYAAAAKTFHSTSILRHLFYVHTALAEFDIAIKAFDSYTAIVDKGKARAEKTGKHEIGIDSDDIVLLAASDAINVLCLYGQRKEAEKAMEIGQKIMTWLEPQQPQQPQTQSQEASVANGLSPKAHKYSLATAMAYRAIGQSEATWARYTYASRERSELQVAALEHLDTGTSSSHDISTAYVLAQSLLEQRKTNRAIQVLKHALTADVAQALPFISLSNADVEFAIQRRNLPLLHLFALALSARGDFSDALTFCESALEDFIEAGFTCDHQDGVGTRNQNRSGAGLPRRIVSDVDAAGRECMLQIKMTEIDLLILLEDTTYAASRRVELIQMYEQLLGSPRPEEPRPSTNGDGRATLTKKPGTIRSIRHSVFGRPKTARKSIDSSTFKKPEAGADITNSAAPPVAGRPTPPVMLTFTNENGEKVEATDAKTMKNRLSMSIRRGRYRHSHDVSQLTKEREPSKPRASSHPHIDARAVAEQRQSEEIKNEKPRQSYDTSGTGMTGEEQVPSGPSILHVVNTEDVKRDLPEPVFTRLQRQTHRSSILIQIWLFIAKMYTKEGLYEDARGAINEADELIESLKVDVAAVEASARNWNNRGWGFGRSIVRLSADVWAARGQLLEATGKAHQAAEAYERSLCYYHDHPIAIIGLSGLLLDMFESKMPMEPPKAIAVLDPEAPSRPAVTSSDVAKYPTQQTKPSTTEKMQNTDSGTTGFMPREVTDAPTTEKSLDEEQSSSGAASLSTAPSTAELNRLAARDRAYVLLSTLTKLGEGWDNAEAWFMLARAYELMGTPDKAEESLWWVVELEDTRPVRGWREAGVFS